MRALFYQLRQVLRGLRRRPGFTTATLLCLALGVGASVAIFSLVDGALLRPMPFRDPDRVVYVGNAVTRGGSVGQAPLSWPDVMSLREGQSAVRGLAGYRNVTVTLQRGDRPERLIGMGVTEGLFETLGVAPLLGRTFTAEETGPAGPRVVLLTWRLWQRTFGGDPGIVGRTINLQGEPHTVVGVMPAGFRFPWWSDLYVPLQADAAAASRNSRSLRAVGRLADGVTLAQARHALEGAQEGLREQYPDSYGSLGIYLESYQAEERGYYRQGLLVLMMGAALVLLVAAVNVANLLLARGAGREREMAVRVSLGAGRGAMARQLLLESLVLGGLGGIAGLALGVAGRDTLLAINPRPQPFWMDFSLDGRVVAFVVAVTLFVTLVFGLAPMLFATRPRPGAALRAGGDRNASGRPRWGSFLVAGEVALALALLVSAGAMVRGFRSLLDVDPGFNPRGALTMEVSLTPADYPDAASRRVVLTRVLEETAALPGVSVTGAVQSLPLGGDLWGQAFQAEGAPAPEPGEAPVGNYRVVHGDYFAAAGIHLLQGRTFTPGELRDGADVLVVNATLAHRYWPGESAVGKRVRLGSSEKARWWDVIGVAADVRHSSLSRGEVRPGFYVPYGSQPLSSMILVLRSGGDPTALADPARRAVNRVAPTAPVFDVRTLADYYDSATGEPRFYTFLMGVFSVLALILAVLGVTGVTSFVVRRRTREIGIRTALGATPGRVLGTVLLQGMAPVAAGSLVGVALGYLLLRRIAPSFYGVRAFDPMAYAVLVGVLTLAGLLAVWLPARRALRVDPGIVLQEE